MRRPRRQRRKSQSFDAMIPNLLTTLALCAGLIGWLNGYPFMTGLWTELPVIGKVGTPLLFDIGVYFTVIGVTVSMLHAFEEA